MKWNITKKFQWERLESSILGTQNPQREIQNPRLSWIPSHGEKQMDRKSSTFSLAVLLHHQGSATSWATFPCFFFGPNLHDFAFLFSTSWTIMAHQTLAIWQSRICANYKKLRCWKGTLATEFHSLKRVQGQVFEKFCQKRDVSDEELEKHFRLEIVRPKNSATSSLNSPSRTLVETNFLSIVN